MIQNVYLEKEIIDHPRTEYILSKLKKPNILEINKFSEIFNLNNQSFRIQKKNPSLILARKRKGFVLPTPNGFGIGTNKNYYFSHMYNCIYDCRYCFLQGMYNSANFVVFVNFENYFSEIKKIVEFYKRDKITFFSGYDCDSLALDGITNFVNVTLNNFKNIPTALIELRTKSVAIENLLSQKPIKNCVIAYSLLPEKASIILDNKTPSIRRRIRALNKLVNHGWKIGLRFDPLIFYENWKKDYKELFSSILGTIDVKSIHSVSCGPLRFPNKMYNKIFKLYPEEKIFSASLELRNKSISYNRKIENEMISFCHKEFKKYLSDSIIFSCTPDLTK